MMFDRMGMPAAANIINVVVITAAASSCNGGIFSTGRMLYSLALRGQAPGRSPTSARDGFRSPASTSRPP